MAGKEDKLGSPQTARLNNSAPRCQLSSQGPLHILSLFLQNWVSHTPSQIKKKKKGRAASLSFPRKEVQSAHQLVSPRVEDRSRVPGAGGLGISGVLRVTSLCPGQQLGG